MDGPAKMTTPMPQKAERAPPPPSGAPADAPPPPPNPSDMTFHDKNAEKTKGDPDQKVLDQKRQELIDQMRRQQLLQDLDAPIGKEDRPATSPDGSSSDAGTSSQAGLHDPGLKKWVKAANAVVEANFHPILSCRASNPSMKVTVNVHVAADGSPEGEATMKNGSQNASFDGACMRVFQMVQRLPPVPAKWPNGLGTNLDCVCPK